MHTGEYVFERIRQGTRPTQIALGNYRHLLVMVIMSR